MENIINKEIGVLGIGKSGVSVSELLQKYNNKVFISDRNEKKNINKEYIEKLEQSNIEYETGKHSLEKLIDKDFIVLSPGIPLTSKIVQELKKNNKKILGEIEVASNFINTKFIAITGTNGKTTTTTLIGKILENSKFTSFYAGNIGYSLSEAILNNNKQIDYTILELSSFQLDSIENFKPYISVITNITPDHLNVYSDFEEYLNSKKNIFKNQDEKDIAVLNYTDENLKKISFNIKPVKKYFNNEKEIYYENGFIYFQGEEYINVSEIELIGNHNYENIMAAILTAETIGVDRNIIKTIIQKFKGVEHRLELFKVLNKRKLYNDSKATNVESVICSLSAFKDKSVILIAGGSEKKSNYKKLDEIINSKVKTLILTGESKKKIADAISFDNTYIESDFKKAVLMAYEKSEEYDNIVLSPACASYDKFKNFEERGKYFKNIFNEIK